MPGYYGETRITMDGYKLGCQNSHLMMRQVTNTEDLKGREGLGMAYNGTRASNVIGNYYTPGATQEGIPSYIVSEIGGD